MVQEVTALREGPDGGIGVSSILLECPREVGNVCLFTYIWWLTILDISILTILTLLFYTYCIHTETYKIHSYIHHTKYSHRDIYIHNTFINIQLYNIQNTQSYWITYIHCYRYTYKIHAYKFTYFALKERIQYEK